MDKEKRLLELKMAMIYHKWKRATDPEYRKRSDETGRRYAEHLYGFTFDENDPPPLYEENPEMSKVTLEEYLEMYYGVKPKKPTEKEIEIIRRNHKKILQLGREALNQKQNQDVSSLNEPTKEETAVKQRRKVTLKKTKITKPWQKYFTKKQYWQLPHPGRVMADYWTQWLPDTCKRMYAEGTLYSHLFEEGERLIDLQVDLIRNGMAEDGAWEVAKEEIFSLPPER